MQKKVNKEGWVDMFKEVGLSDADMEKWHRLFEARHPESHGEFLAWLGIPDEEIAGIRKNCG
jgi:hypothetical protein